jgi:hypothetical protein
MPAGSIGALIRHPAEAMSAGSQHSPSKGLQPVQTSRALRGAPAAHESGRQPAGKAPLVDGHLEMPFRQRPMLQPTKDLAIVAY